METGQGSILALIFLDCAVPPPPDSYLIHVMETCAATWKNDTFLTIMGYKLR